MSDLTFKPDAYCGLFCAACPNYQRTLANPDKQREGADCKGCKSDLLCTSWCAHCTLKDCAKSRNVAFCNECSDFPCANLQAFKDDVNYPYHAEVFAYLETIKTKGKDVWLAEMDKRWSCESCGTRFDWWTQTCSSCGKPVAGYRNPAIKD